LVVGAEESSPPPQAVRIRHKSTAATARPLRDELVFMEFSLNVAMGKAKPAGSEVAWRTGSREKMQQGKTRAVLDRMEPKKELRAPHIAQSR